MILAKNLRFYNCINDEQVSPFSKYLPQKGESYENLNTSLMGFYAVVIQLLGLTGADILKALNSSRDLNLLNKKIIGFMCEYKITNSVSLIRASQRLLNKIASLHQLVLLDVTLYESLNRENTVYSSEINECIELFRNSEINTDLLQYFIGWRCLSKDDTVIELYLSNIYDVYNKEFTKKLANTLYFIARRKSSATATSSCSQLTKLFEVFAIMYPTLDSLYSALSAKNQHKTIIEVMHYMVLQVKSQNKCIKTFIGKWNVFIGYFERYFTGTKGWFSEALIPLPKPSFITSMDSNPAVGEPFNKGMQERILTKIPLHLKDSVAMDIIFNRIRNDVEHIKYSCDELMKQTMAKHIRNQKYILSGSVKIKGKSKSTNKSQYVPIGAKNLNNVLATFNAIGFRAGDGGTGDFSKFLGFTGETETLKVELNIPTERLLYPFLLRLVLEHPELTPSPLCKWELYDKNGKVVGFCQSANSNTIELFKKRKGSTLAQQTIILNDVSTKICQDIIAITSHARSVLKEAGDQSWRFMLLRVRALTKLPLRYNNNVELSQRDAKLWREDYLPPSPYLSDQQSISELLDNTTLRNARVSAAVLVYMKTKSVVAMSEALGHTKHNPQLIDRYLPTALYEYFVNRWVRIFQNALIFEAMKNSFYLYDAMDIDKIFLKEFVKNHSITDITEQLQKLGSSASYESESQNSNESIVSAVIILNTAQFQVYIAVIEVINVLSSHDLVTKDAEKIYSVGSLLINIIEEHIKGVNQRMYRLSDELVKSYECAKKHPLDKNKIKEIILCR